MRRSLCWNSTDRPLCWNPAAASRETPT
jgi:hypothetical protein